MRLTENIANPVLVILGWFLSILALYLISKRKSQLSNQELSTLAGMGAFIFILQSFFIIPIPFSVFPVFFTLSGITLAITIAGPTRGILVGSVAYILNHVLIVGSLSMLGINLFNMIIAGILIGWLPAQMFHNPFLGRRLRYLGTFLGAFLYTLLQGLLILIEIAIFFSSESDLSNLILGFIFFVILLGIVEGFFTAIAASYYHRTFIATSMLPIDYNPMELEIEDETLDVVEKIDFDLKFIEKMKKELAV
ncbi:MAG: Cobalt transport protein CbiM [Candidatus Heimdallarchaeota archaeon LC_2]|nr:MAG: Cobalt transport protein CbiM [Candidatus Heimdallarchaeota archaeon LC_2]